MRRRTTIDKPTLTLEGLVILNASFNDIDEVEEGVERGTDRGASLFHPSGFLLSGLRVLALQRPQEYFTFPIQ